MYIYIYGNKCIYVLTVYTACPIAGNMFFIYHFYGCAVFFLHIIFGNASFCCWQAAGR